MLSKNPELKFINESYPTFTNQLITLNFGIQFLHEQFLLNKPLVNQFSKEFFKSEVSVISIFSNDLSQKVDSVNASDSNFNNKLSDKKSSKESDNKAGDLSDMEKFLLEQFKAIDITNRV